MSDPKRPQRPMTLQEIRMKAAQNAAMGRSVIPMDRLRQERGQVLDPTPAAKPDAAVENAVENMATHLDAVSSPPDAVMPDEDAEALREALRREPKPFTPNVTVQRRMALVPPQPPRDDVATPVNTTPFVDELAHATIQLGMWERKINQQIMIGFPDGRKIRLGDLLMQVGEHLMKLDEKAPRILIPGLVQ